MSLNKNRWLVVLVLNLIRIALGSYFIGVSLDLVPGVDQRALFLPFLSYEWADLVGSTVLFCISVAFMTGIETRTFALALAIFVMCSSGAKNFFPFDLSHMAGFWRDITLSAAVLMAYTNVGRIEIQKPTLPKRTPRTRTSDTSAKVTARKVKIAPSKEVRS